MIYEQLCQDFEAQPWAEWKAHAEVHGGLLSLLPDANRSLGLHQVFAFGTQSLDFRKVRWPVCLVPEYFAVKQNFYKKEVRGAGQGLNQLTLKL